MSEADDFEYQLQQEALEAQKKDSKTDNPAIYTDKDGTEFEWDPVQRAWFPRITDDFVAMYQASYGNYEETQKDEPVSESQPGPSRTTEQNIPSGSKIDKEDNTLDDESKKRKAEETEPTWFEEDELHNTKVYVSNLPTDVTEDEFAEIMKKCGFITKDEKGKLKVKLYKDKEGNNKGDGLCSYIKVESVQLALDVLDGYDVRGQQIKVERAKFELKGEYDPSLKPKKKKLNRKDKEKQKRKVEKLFDWRPDPLQTERSAHEKVVIIKNMFNPEIFTQDPKLILEYRKDVREECEERCGPVKKVDIYDLHPEGVAKVIFQEFDGADKCIELMNGRYFAGRRLEAAFWDGKTKYVIKETEEEIENRIKKWDEFLEGAE